MITEIATLLTVLGIVLVMVVRGRHAMSGQPVAQSGNATQFVPVQDLDTLDEWWARSDEQPVILFLHDPGCPISAGAYRQVAQLGGIVPLINVRYRQQLSWSVAARTGVRHESPQVFVLDQGRARWSASHYGITIDAVTAALQSG